MDMANFCGGAALALKSLAQEKDPD